MAPEALLLAPQAVPLQGPQEPLTPQVAHTQHLQIHQDQDQSLGLPLTYRSCRTLSL